MEKVVKVVENSVRQTVPEGYRVSKDFMLHLNREVAKLVVKAVLRCQDNGRKTLRGCDI